MTIALYDRAVEATRFIKAKIDSQRQPRISVVLGSGLGAVADAASDRIEISYSDIPHFVPSTVEGHDGRLIVGSIGSTPVLLMKGRVHFYEGYSMEEITLPIRVFALLGIRCVVLTNAAGGTDPHLSPGSLMIITDHINLMGDNPLRGQNEPRFGPRFPDMSAVYTPACIHEAHEVARETGVTLAEGVYIALRGPCYETPAEVRMLRDLGADAIGMSTVPEAIVARHCGMNVVGLSCITNVAAGIGKMPINHEDVIRVGEQAGRQLAELIVRLVPRLAASASI